MSAAVDSGSCRIPEGFAGRSQEHLLICSSWSSSSIVKAPEGERGAHGQQMISRDSLTGNSVGRSRQIRQVLCGGSPTMGNSPCRWRGSEAQRWHRKGFVVSQNELRSVSVSRNTIADSLGERRLDSVGKTRVPIMSSSLVAGKS